MYPITTGSPWTFNKSRRHLSFPFKCWYFFFFSVSFVNLSISRNWFIRCTTTPLCFLFSNNIKRQWHGQSVSLWPRVSHYFHFLLSLSLLVSVHTTSLSLLLDIPYASSKTLSKRMLSWHLYNLVEIFCYIHITNGQQIHPWFHPIHMIGISLFHLCELYISVLTFVRELQKLRFLHSTLNSFLCNQLHFLSLFFESGMSLYKLSIHTFFCHPIVLELTFFLSLNSFVSAESSQFKTSNSFALIYKFSVELI